MHQAVARALEEIDAAVFSGDTFSTDRDAFGTLKDYIDRWSRAIPEMEDALISYEEDQGLRRFVRGQRVKVLDQTTGPLLGKVVTIVDRNSDCTAEWEVRTDGGVEWVIHSCHLRAVDEDVLEALQDLDERI